MDYSANGYSFNFEFEKIRLLGGIYNYVAKIVRILDTLNETVVSEGGLSGETYGRDKQDARKAIEEKARAWAEAQR